MFHCPRRCLSMSLFLLTHCYCCSRGSSGVFAILKCILLSSLYPMVYTGVMVGGIGLSALMCWGWEVVFPSILERGGRYEFRAQRIGLSAALLYWGCGRFSWSTF
uniref:Uncharacterized protein n=1 Tax=Cacopsylla melanoneura TaxID=428564 RepID=A0A8D8XFR5_9HEMI